MNRFLLRPLVATLLSFSSLAFVGCGANFREVNVKQYVLGLHSTDEAIISGFENLISEYNDDVGFEALRFERDPSEVNSSLILTKGLQQRDGKVGWGQWIVTTDSSSPSAALFSSEEQERVHRFSMRVELDEDYVLERLSPDNKDKHYELKKLFYHEVGHGFQMDHNPSPQSVMYFDISGVKDFNGYYKAVENFFRQ